MKFISILNKRQFRDIDYNRWLFISTILLGSGLLIALLIGPEITQCVVKYMFTLMPGSYIINQQRRMHVTYNIYLFNVTNPQEVINGGKPKLQEIGPYVFSGNKTKINMVNNEKEDTVAYDIYNSFTYRPDLTLPLTGDEVLTVIHPLFVPGMVKMASEMPEMLHFVKAGLSMIFPNMTDPFMTLSAKEPLYSGIMINCDVKEFAAKAICAALANDDRINKVNGSQQLLSYSMLYQINNKKQGNYKVLRGMENVHDVGKIIEFNGKRELDVFEADECNVINGTDELFFAPFMERNDILEIFDCDGCGSYQLMFRRETKVKGRKTVRKTGHLDPQKKPACLCNEYLGCLPEGAVDLNQCLEGPVAGSLPHFYDSAPELQEMFEGLNPVEEKHFFGYDFDLLTGVFLRMMRRYQVNFRTIPIKDDPLMGNIASVPFPMFWFEELISATQSEEKVIARIHFWDIFFKVIGWLIFSLGVLGAAISAAVVLVSRVPITPVNKLENPHNTQRSSVNEIGSASVTQPETPDSISTIEQEQQEINEFEMYNRVQINSKDDPQDDERSTVPDDEEDEGIDGR